MSQNASAMQGVFATLESAGIAKKDMQTSNFSLSPRYDYSAQDGSPPKLVGYTASNQLTVKVRDLDTLGKTMDAVVSAGGTNFNGLSFGLDDDTEALNEARRSAMKTAFERAELYADAAGYKVSRIVTISENSGSNNGPQPMEMKMMRASDSSTPIANGEVSYSADVNVVFELTK